MTSTFVMDKKRGKKGESIAISYLEDLGFEVKDVSEDKEYQAVDIDLIAGNHTIEVKTDFQRTGNIFFETVSNKDKGTLGNMYMTEATFLFYILVEYNLMITIPIKEMLKWVEKNKHTFREVNSRWSKSIGLLIPIEQLLNSELEIGKVEI